MNQNLDGTIKISGVHFALHYRQPPTGNARVDYVLAVHSDEGASVAVAMDDAEKLIGMAKEQVQRESSAVPAQYKNGDEK